MKIALVIERFDPRRGGRELSTAQLAAALAQAGHDVTVLTMENANNIPTEFRVEVLNVSGASKVARFKNFAFAVAGRKKDFDILHGMAAMPCLDVYQPRGGTSPAQMRASVKRSNPLLMPLKILGWSMNPLRRLLRKYEQGLMADESVACLAVSQTVADEFKKYFNRRENVHVVYNAVDIPQNAGVAEHQLWRNEVRTQLGVAVDEPLYLTVANNLKLKGVDWLIRAFAKRGGQGRLVVIGSKDFSEMETLAASLGLSGRVIFREHTDNIFKWYSAADAVVLLSWQDACSRVILEAVRWGTPSMSTQLNGASEILKDGAGVVVMRPDDIDAVVAGLDRLADANERAMFAAACASAGEKLTWQRHCRELLEIYEKQMEQK